MPSVTLKQAAQWCGGFVEPKYENVVFCGANNDTRIIKPDQLFIVLQGARDGHDFIPMAMEKVRLRRCAAVRWEIILPFMWTIPESRWGKSLTKS